MSEQSQRARQHEEYLRAHRQFLQAAAQGTVRALDRFGNPIDVGDVVLYHPQQPFELVFRVQDVGAIVDPRNPNMLQVTLVVKVPIGVRAQSATPNLVIIGKKDQSQPQEGAPSAGLPQDAPQGGEPDPHLPSQAGPGLHLQEPPPQDPGDPAVGEETHPPSDPAPTLGRDGEAWPDRDSNGSWEPLI